jgi:two-component system nitrogen regulation response regulator NtrX
MGEAKPELESEARDLLLAHSWPGNVRELKNLAERITVMGTGETIRAETLRGLLDRRSGAGLPPNAPASAGAGEKGGKNFENKEKSALQRQLSPDIFMLGYSEAKEQFEKTYLEFQLAQHGGVIAHTAEAIGIYPSNLHAKIHKYGLRTER